MKKRRFSTPLDFPDVRWDAFVLVSILQIAVVASSKERNFLLHKIPNTIHFQLKIILMN